MESRPGKRAAQSATRYNTSGRRFAAVVILSLPGLVRQLVKANEHDRNLEEFKIDDSDLKKCLVSVRYLKLCGDPWRRVGRQPQIETYLSDVSEKYCQPQVEYVSPSRVVIRVFDTLAVDLTRLIDRLGDFSGAVARCDDCLRNEVLGSDEADFRSCLEPWY